MSYTSLKRVLGETKLELKTLLLFGVVTQFVLGRLEQWPAMRLLPVVCVIGK